MAIFAMGSCFARIAVRRDLSLSEQKMIIDGVKKVIARSCDPQTRDFVSDFKSTEFLRQQRGVFVTLYKDGKLRGCIGHLRSKLPLYTLIPRVAKKAAFEDRRFPPVTCEELPEISVEVSVLTNPRPIKSYKEIDIKKHGIILHQGSKSAVFLPKVATDQGWNLDTTLTQLALKAGLSANAWKDRRTTFEVFESIDFS